MFEELAHPRLRNVVADQSFFAHIVARDHECALKIYTRCSLVSVFTSTILWFSINFIFITTTLETYLILSEALTSIPKIESFAIPLTHLSYKWEKFKALPKFNIIHENRKTPPGGFHRKYSGDFTIALTIWKFWILKFRPNPTDLNIAIHLDSQNQDHMQHDYHQ